MAAPDHRPPSAADLQRLLAFLSIRPCVEAQALVQFLEQVPTIDLTSQQIRQFDYKRQTVVDNRDHRQVGLFDFYLGLIFLGYKRYADAVPYFGLAKNQWSLYRERPHVCLARFAMGAAYHHDMDLPQATGTYAEVEQEASKIRHELQDGYLSQQISYQQDFADYRGFIEHLVTLLGKAQISLNLDELTGVRPVIPPPQVKMNTDESRPHRRESRRFDQKRSPPRYPTPITIGRKEWFQVVRKTEPFLDEIEEGDWLYAPSEQVGEREAEGHVIIETPVGGSIEVKSEEQRSGPALFLARFIRNTTTGEVHVVTRSDYRSVTLDPRQIWGNVIRHCKNS